jgi:hypothetical protein
LSFTNYGGVLPTIVSNPIFRLLTISGGRLFWNRFFEIFWVRISLLNTVLQILKLMLLLSVFTGAFPLWNTPADARLSLNELIKPFFHYCDCRGLPTILSGGGDP